MIIFYWLILLISILLFISLCIIALIRFYYNKKIKKLIDQNYIRIDKVLELSDQPILLLTDKHTVVYANNLFNRYIKTETGNNTDDFLQARFTRIGTTWMNVLDILSLERKHNNNSAVYITDEALFYIDKEYKYGKIRITHFSSTIEQNKDINYIEFAIHITSDIMTEYNLNKNCTITELPNYHKAKEDINAMSKKSSFAIGFISIDNFLEVTQIIGFNQAVEKITLISKYLRIMSLKYGFSIYYMGANHFLILIPNEKHETNYLEIVDRFRGECENYLRNQYRNILLSISSGISIYPDIPINMLLDSAYNALLQSNTKGESFVTIAKSNQSANIAEGKIGYEEIKKAFEYDQIDIYYQPICNAIDNSITGAEVLVRWIHPERGILEPSVFMHLVEKTGFMRRLSALIIIKAITQIGIWKFSGFLPVQISINLSMKEFEFGDFHYILHTLLKKNNLDGSVLKIEVTETVAMSNEKYTLDQFIKFKDMGISISLDDFGTGYSSFSTLKSLPVDTLKIDKSFISDLTSNKDHQTIVEAMIAMAHTLGLEVVAEGIEDINTASMLKEMECDYLQGYYFGKPMPTFEFQELIRTNRQLSISDDIIPIKQ